MLMKEPIFKEYATKVADLYSVSEDELFSKSKKRAIVDARHLLYYLCKSGRGRSDDDFEGQQARREHPCLTFLSVAIYCF